MFTQNKIFQFLSIALAVLVLRCSNNDTPQTSSPPDKDVTFVKTLGGSNNESARSIIATSDGGYAILGYTQSSDGDITNKTNSSFDYWLLKFDANHALQWQQTYGGASDDRGSCLIQTQDNGFALLGSRKSTNGFNDFWVIRTNASGHISWETSFGFSGTDEGISIIETNDNGLLLTGVLDVTASGGQGNTKHNLTKRHAGGDYWAVKLDASGNLEWSKFFGGTFTDTPYDVVQTDDNGYILVGSSDSADTDIKNNKGTYDFWVIKISETGNLVWETSFGGTQLDEARGIAKTNDGNFIIIGDTRSNDKDVGFNKGAADFWVIKISNQGDLLWEKTFGGSSFDAARAIHRTKDNGFVISGSSRSADTDLEANNGQNDAWVIKLNNQGNLEWQKSLGGADVDLAYDAIQLNDNSIVVVGESNSSNADIPENKGFSDLLIFNIK
ncbi:hypothetical protein [Seonamhaeicola marinus]|uniref:Bulb-type lectin domain-containing protein n=1 Tax=Seonamhaeicola marinus TaxID=1912246 RepID=A0A5D0HJ99_9FLAO|nr:hypothetical protein [Seonamhaeicola marinus]TYA70137.1 hypothetical protein FUA24_22915 [Seonamhaeicola marinus]